MSRTDSPAPPAASRADAALLPSVLSADEWSLLSAAGVTRAVLPGEELFRRGDDAQSMYIIDSGQVRLGFEDGLADKILGAGQYFGGNRGQYGSRDARRAARRQRRGR